MTKISVGILGATGLVGQRYVELLASHPWFELTFLASSELSAGKEYRAVVSNRWHGAHPLPEALEGCQLYRVDDIEAARSSCRLVFSALSNDAAKSFEEKYAAAGLGVISSASCHRMAQDVPILIPEVNGEHTKYLPIQKKNRQWGKGFIVAKPNCAIQSFMMPLAPLHRRFGVKALAITTLQAASGAGYPGVSAMDLLGNVIPYIPTEEEKLQSEPLKIWGEIKDDAIVSAGGIAISAHCNRVAVLDGHLACVSVAFVDRPLREEILTLWDGFIGLLPEIAELPSSPLPSLIYLPEEDRPQPRRDSDRGGGMSVTVGRLRDCPLFHYRFTALSHNTIRGAAGGGVLIAELLLRQGFLA